VTKWREAEHHRSIDGDADDEIHCRDGSSSSIKIFCFGTTSIANLLWVLPSDPQVRVSWPSCDLPSTMTKDNNFLLAAGRWRVGDESVTENQRRRRRRQQVWVLH
jgi:hypothetical protein